ncbi:MAG: DUF3343 domain-containing protein [Oscillospiraceae bacterium]|nr:DUF3343 domain-containing protein [Oscillospiraceae bacterium]
MRAKLPRLVVTFSTTAAAMEMERYCQANGISGRLIPTPREITADCGLAWSAPSEAESAVLQAANNGCIEYAAVYHLVI